MCFEGKAKELLGFVLYFISLCKRKNPELNVKTSCLPRDSTTLVDSIKLSIFQKFIDNGTDRRPLHHHFRRLF